MEGQLVRPGTARSAAVPAFVHPACAESSKLITGLGVSKSLSKEAALAQRRPLDFATQVSYLSLQMQRTLVTTPVAGEGPLGAYKTRDLVAASRERVQHAGASGRLGPLPAGIAANLVSWQAGSRALLEGAREKLVANTLAEDDAANRAAGGLLTVRGLSHHHPSSAPAGGARTPHSHLATHPARPSSASNSADQSAAHSVSPSKGAHPAGSSSSSSRGGGGVSVVSQRFVTAREKELVAEREAALLASQLHQIRASRRALGEDIERRIQMARRPKSANLATKVDYRQGVREGLQRPMTAGPSSSSSGGGAGGLGGGADAVLLPPLPMTASTVVPRKSYYGPSATSLSSMVTSAVPIGPTAVHVVVGGRPLTLEFPATAPPAGGQTSRPTSAASPRALGGRAPSADGQGRPASAGDSAPGDPMALLAADAAIELALDPASASRPGSAAHTLSRPRSGRRRAVRPPRSSSSSSSSRPGSASSLLPPLHIPSSSSDGFGSGAEDVGSAGEDGFDDDGGEGEEDDLGLGFDLGPEDRHVVRMAPRLPVPILVTGKRPVTIGVPKGKKHADRPSMAGWWENEGRAQALERQDSDAKAAHEARTAADEAAGKAPHASNTVPLGPAGVPLLPEASIQPAANVVSAVPLLRSRMGAEAAYDVDATVKAFEALKIRGGGPSRQVVARALLTGPEGTAAGTAAQAARPVSASSGFFGLGENPLMRKKRLAALALQTIAAAKKGAAAAKKGGGGKKK
jgi:hypothetical protein